jgi:hypothetical protein
MSLKYKTVDEYIASFPAEIREKLETIRELIKKNSSAGCGRN